MKYFVISDVHGFFSLMVDTLAKNGFDINNTNHKLIICGDYFDRGEEELEMQAFLMGMIKKEKVILIRGNHEDLMMDFVNHFEEYSRELAYSHHYENGTADTAFQLCKKDWITNYEYMLDPEGFVRDIRNSNLVKYIIPKTLNYFETDHYIFTHGYIPCEILEEEKDGKKIKKYAYMKAWRNADKLSWQKARWLNGQEIAKEFNIIEPNKTIICGHNTASFGHSKYEGKGEEFGKDSDFSPFYSKGIIAIDACTAFSKKMNCLIIDD